MAILSRIESDLINLKAELLQINKKINVSIHVVDLVQPDETKEAFNVIKSIYDTSIKSLVCFAGSWIKSKPLADLEIADFLEGLESNFFCTFNAIKEVVRICEPELKGLSIITIGGSSGVWMNPEAPVMSVAKGAIRHLSRVIAKQLLLKEVHVAHIIIDGPILNERGKYLNATLQEKDFIKLDSVASEIHHVINQSPDAWTFEWDIRPWTWNTKLI